MNRNRRAGNESGDFMCALLDVVWLIMKTYVYIIIASAIMSWLIAFNVINGYNQVVATIGNFLYAVTEPLLRPIRRFLPNLGGLDISPVILLLIIFFLQNVMIRYLYGPSCFL